jgi:type IX secretion system PorP/SprF family membrane protein
MKAVGRTEFYVLREINLPIQQFLYIIVLYITNEQMKQGFFILSMLLLQISVLSQQRPQFTQYMLNKYNENPAYGGLERSLSVFTSFRDQYSDFPGNPKTFYFGADMPFYLWNGAVGMTFMNQKAGVFSNSNLRISYNYVLGLPFGFLSFGGRVGIDYLNVDGSGIITPQGNYEGTFNHNDPILEQTNFRGVGPSWELGSYFMGRNLQAGLTISEFPSHRYTVGSSKYTRAFNASLFVMYKIKLDENIEISPSCLIKADAAVVQADIGAIANINQSLTAGINLRGYSTSSFDALSVIIGTNLGKKYKVYYSFDFGLSELRKVNQGTHEIMLTYNLQKLIGIGLPPKIIYNPRDL